VAGTLEGRVAGGAVVSGGGDMGLRQRGLDGEGCCGRVGGGQGATFGLRGVSGAASRASKRASTAAEGRLAHTSVVKAVLPAPVGPSSKMMGLSAALAADL
jgi:hypothetical protein